MKKNKILIVILAVVIVFAVFFFLNKTNTKSDKKIVIWAYDSTASAAEKAVEIYKRNHPNNKYEYEVVKIGQEDMVEKLKVQLSAGSLETLPNIFYDEDYNFLEYVKYYTDYFVDLTDEINIKDYMDFKAINVTYNGKIYAIPFDSAVGVTFYRKDILEKAGYDENSLNNITWDQFIEIGKNVKAKTGYSMLPIAPSGDMEGRLMYQSAGTWFFDDDGKANISNNEAFKDTFKTLKKVFDSGIVYRASSWDDIISSIANQKIASLVGASWWAPIIGSYEDQSGLWRVTTMPKIGTGNNYSNVSNLGGGNWFIINKDNKDEAIKFCVETFATNSELINYMADEFSLITVNKNIINELDDDGSEFYGNQKINTQMAEWSKNIIPVKYGLHTYEITYTVGEYAEKYIDGKITLDEAINTLQKEAEKVVSED